MIAAPPEFAEDVAADIAWLDRRGRMLLGRTRRPLDCWSWNATHGRLSSRDSAEPGPWRFDRVPYLQHWHNLISARRLGSRFMGHDWSLEIERKLPDGSLWRPPRVDPWAHRMEQLWLVMGTQSAKTRSLLYAALGFLVDQFPAPKALILPRLKDFKRVLRNRVRPLFTETPRLAAHLPKTASARKSEITETQWYLSSCTIYMLCGELADDLRSFPICDLIWDEFDLLPLDVGGTADTPGQGDPIELGMDRQKTWPRDRLSVGATTPTTVNGHGWRRLCSGSHERLLIRCPQCGADQELAPRQLRAPENAPAQDVRLRRLAWWECAHCQHRLADDWQRPGDSTKDRLVREAADRGHWIPGEWKIDGQHPHGHWTPAAHFDDRHQLADWTPPATTVRTGQANSLYSQFISFSDFKAHELQAEQKGSLEEKIAHVNGWCAEPWIPHIAAPITLADIGGAASSDYQFGACPPGPVHVITICDQQGNRRDDCSFPYVVRGVGRAGESWLITAGTARGWEALTELERRSYQIGGKTMPNELTVMDGSNGMMRVPVQSWAAKEQARRIVLTGRFWPDYLWQARVAGAKKEARNRRIVTGARVFNFHANAYRTELSSRMTGKGSAPWHLPCDPPDWYAASLTAEEQVETEIRVNGYKKRVHVWQPRQVHDERGQITVREDNHWWDAEVMCLAACDVLGWSSAKPPAPPRKYGLIKEL